MQGISLNLLQLQSVTRAQIIQSNLNEFYTFLGRITMSILIITYSYRISEEIAFMKYIVK